MAYLQKLESIETGRRANARLNAMVGNSLLKGVSEASVKEEDAHTKVNFYWKPGANHHQVIDILEDVVGKAKVDTNFGVLLFQNSVRSVARMNDKDLNEELNQTFSRIESIMSKQNSKGFKHRLAIAEEQYAPELVDFFWRHCVSECHNKQRKWK